MTIRKPGFQTHTVDLSAEVNSNLDNRSSCRCCTSEQGLLASAAVTVVALFLFGAHKSRVMQQPVLAGALKVVMTGILAAAAAFLIAKRVA